MGGRRRLFRALGRLAGRSKRGRGGIIERRGPLPPPPPPYLHRTWACRNTAGVLLLAKLLISSTAQVARLPRLQLLPQSKARRSSTLRRRRAAAEAAAWAVDRGHVHGGPAAFWWLAHLPQIILRSWSGRWAPCPSRPLTSRLAGAPTRRALPPPHHLADPGVVADAARLRPQPRPSAQPPRSAPNAARSGLQLAQLRRLERCRPAAGACSSLGRARQGRRRPHAHGPGGAGRPAPLRRRQQRRGGAGRVPGGRAHLCAGLCGAACRRN